VNLILKKWKCDKRDVFILRVHFTTCQGKKKIVKIVCKEDKPHLQAGILNRIKVNILSKLLTQCLKDSKCNCSCKVENCFVCSSCYYFGARVIVSVGCSIVCSRVSSHSCETLYESFYLTLLDKSTMKLHSVIYDIIPRKRV